jgi:hypothetical protein
MLRADVGHGIGLPFVIGKLNQKRLLALAPETLHYCPDLSAGKVVFRDPRPTPPLQVEGSTSWPRAPFCVARRQAREIFGMHYNPTAPHHRSPVAVVNEKYHVESSAPILRHDDGWLRCCAFKQPSPRPTGIGTSKAERSGKYAGLGLPSS